MMLKRYVICSAAITILAAASSAATPLLPGDMLAADYYDDVVHHYDGTTFAYKGTFATGIDGPTGVVYLPDGDLAVAASRQDQILRFDGQTGVYEGVIFQDSIDNPRGIALDEKGMLWIPALNDDQIVQVDPTTGVELQRLSVGRPMAITVSHERVYVASQVNASVQHFDRQTGAYLGILAQGMGTNPQAICTAPNGGILVSVSPVGLYHLDWQTGQTVAFRSGPGPEGIAIGPDDLVYISDETGGVSTYDPVTLALGQQVIANFEGSHGVTFVPEPATLSLLAVGGLALIRRRRAA